MYLAKYKLNNNIEVEQEILKIDILDNKKNMEVYNFCLKEIFKIDKTLYENIAFRVSIVNGKIEILLFLTSTNVGLHLDRIKEHIFNNFTLEMIEVTIPTDRMTFDKIIDLNFTSINRLSNSYYTISSKQIGIDFTAGNFVETMVDIAIKRQWSFVYQFQLKPYANLEKKELERYAKKYILQLEDEVYIPENLSVKLNSIANNIRDKDFFMDEVFCFQKETKEFYEMLLFDEFALELSTYGFEDLPLESDDLAVDILNTGLSSCFIDEVSEITQIFSSVSEESLEEFLFKDLKVEIQNYSKNNISKSYDIFISYSTVNTKEAEKVCIELEDISYKCWYAPRDILPSQAYPEQIIKGIKESKYFILLHSKDSTVSKYVLREVTKALSLNKIIIPILLDKVELSENMEFILETCQWIDASAGDINIKIDELKELLSNL